MFAGLKNKIKEETGDDVNKISSLISAGPSKSASTKGRHSRQGSTTSLGSFTIDGKDDGTANAMDMKLVDGRVVTPKEFKKLESKEDEWRKKLQKKDEEFSVQSKKIEESWKKKLDEKDKEYQKLREKLETESKRLVSENNDLHSRIIVLHEEVKKNEVYKSKICQYQEDLDQLEGFQTQEMAKIKHLLLEKEQNLNEKNEALNKCKKHIDELTAEVRKLQAADRELQDSLDNLETLRHKSEQDKASLTTRLVAEEETTRHLKDRVAVLEARCRAECIALGAELTIDERIQGLLGERTLLERLLDEAHTHLAEVKYNWSGTITSLETQVARLCRQASEESAERREAENARDDLKKRLLEAETQMSVVAEEGRKKNLACEKLVEERDKLLAEVACLRSKVDVLERDVDNNLIPSSETALSKEAKIVEDGESVTSLKEEKLDLIKSLDSEKTKCKLFESELVRLKDSFELEKNRWSELLIDMNRERREKDVMMMRNAEVSQEVELVRQELRAVQQEANDSLEKINLLQDDAKQKEEELSIERREKDALLARVQELENASEGNNQSAEGLKDTVIELQSQLLERNKTIKSLQQRVSDMKKTLQRELKVPSRSIDPGGQNGGGIISPYGPAVLTPSSCTDDGDDVNFKYLKHVLFKFLTSREYEAQHLTRAVATLLHFSAEEERLLKETMDWKMSWFRTRPKIGNSSMSRTTPPS